MVDTHSILALTRPVRKWSGSIPLSLDESKASELCREQGLYSHHINQWKQDFMSEHVANNKAKVQSEIKSLRNENKALKKELNRKDKALAETAALLVLQKKSTRSGEPTRTAHDEC